MTAPFRLYGAELSPYSVKVRAYLTFKGLSFEWLSRSNARQAEFAKYAKLPMVPVLVDAEDTALQDSTPIIEALEQRYPEPSIMPANGSLRFLSALIEDYADEWLNKAMFYYRWSFEADRESAAKRIIEMLYEGAEAPAGLEQAIQTRMAGRLHHVGASVETAPVIEASFARVLELLEAHLRSRSYLFGEAPSLADFGLASQLRQLLSDPTPGARIRAEAPHVVVWVERMEAPQALGGFESLDTLRPTLSPLLETEIAGAYLPWMAANAQAVDEDAVSVSVTVAGHAFTQKPQRYAAKAFAEIRRKRAVEAEDEVLASLLAATGCDVYLALAADADGDDDDVNADSPDEAVAAGDAEPEDGEEE